MSPLRLLWLLPGWLTAAAVASPASAAPPLDRAEFQQLVRSVRPDDQALWRTIPWKIALLDAQRVAAAERKPIFIWAMDGHPLGCT